MQRLSILVCWASIVVVVGIAVSNRTVLRPGVLGRADRPVAHLPTTEIELPSMRFPQPAIARVLIENLGGRRLIVSREEEGCACQSDGLVHDWVIGPGSSQWLELSVQPPAGVGRFQKVVRLNTSDSAASSLAITIFGEVSEH
jgi:hypothetical protein